MTQFPPNSSTGSEPCPFLGLIITSNTAPEPELAPIAVFNKLLSILATEYPEPTAFTVTAVIAPEDTVT